MRRKISLKAALFFFLGMAFFLNGCSTMSKKDCLAGNWLATGLQDGKDGYAMKRIERHSVACREYDILVDRAEYEEGWWQGIKKYCVPANGYVLGERLDEYNSACAGDLQHGFLSGYIEGLETAMRDVSWKYREEKEELSRYIRMSQKKADKKTQAEREEEIEEHERELEELEGKIMEIKQLQFKARLLELSYGY